MKIDIDIEDKSVFTQVALILDRKGVREKIFQLRKKWAGVSDVSPQRFGARSKQDWAEVYPTIFPGKPVKNETLFKFQDDVLDLLSKNHLPIVFKDLIVEAIVSGKVAKFSRVRFLPIPRKILADMFYDGASDVLQTRDYDYVLFISPEATEKEVIGEFRALRRSIRRNRGTLTAPLTDTKSSVSEHRDWYWKNLPTVEGGEGKSYDDIARESAVGKGNPQAALQYKSTVGKGIGKYKKLLDQAQKRNLQLH